MRKITMEKKFVVLLDEDGDCIGKYEAPVGKEKSVINHDSLLWIDDRGEFNDYTTDSSFPPETE